MTPDDAEAVFAYASDPEVTRFVIWETHRTLEDFRGLSGAYDPTTRNRR